MIRETVSNELRKEIMLRDKGKCRYCGFTADQIDHVIPYSRGGDNDSDNLVACCQECNYIAAAKKFESFLEKRVFLLTIYSTGKKSYSKEASSRRALNKILKSNDGIGSLSRALIHTLISRYGPWW